MKNEPKKKSKGIKKTGKKKRSKTRNTKHGSKPTDRKSKPIVDILDPVAMENLNYIAHNAPAALVYRGFPWPGSSGKGKRKGRRGGGGGGRRQRKGGGGGGVKRKKRAKKKS